jgi:hypothetical protein
MVDGLHSNVVITFLMGDQNSNEPVMWALFVVMTTLECNPSTIKNDMISFART